jgi:hypothetical protein
MKHLFIIFFFTLNCGYLFSQDWIQVSKFAPDYKYSMPVSPTIMDTLNIRFAFVKSDSMTVFQVLEFKDTPLDSANAGFENALAANSGDTLLAIAQSISAANNSVIITSQNLALFPAYKGLEISMRYNELRDGRVLLVYTRFFYNAHTLISFSISGAEDDLTRLTSNKNLFFDSISL